MTASVSHKGKTGRVASMALATLLSTSFVSATVAPAAANDFYYDQQFENDRDFVPPSTRSVYRDDIGRYYIRHGRKQYIQFWDRESSRDPIIEPRRPRDRDRDRVHAKDRNKNLEAAIIAGVAGLAIGALIGGTQPRQQQVAPIVNQPRYRPLPNNQFPDAPTRHEPRVITYEGGFEPWTRDWANWCNNRYRSFNMSTGTYTGYDGVKRFCVVK